LQGGHGLLEVGLAELSLFVHHKVESVPSLGEDVMLQRDGTVVGVYNVAGLVMDLATEKNQIAT
jgi:hypothetical protein